jgi:hypothetical protein
MLARVRSWQILLQKSLMASPNSDSVTVMRFAVEASDDGAVRSGVSDRRAVCPYRLAKGNRSAPPAAPFTMHSMIGALHYRGTAG